MSFSSDLKTFEINFKEVTEEKLRGSLLSFCTQVIKFTPVDTGRLRGNWQTSFNKPKLSLLDRKQLSNTSGNATSEMQQALSKLKIGDIFYFTNNLPYARVVEFGLYPNPPKDPVAGKTVGGFSKLAPTGMVRVNFKRLVEKLKK